MFNLLSSGTPADTSAVFALLAVLADPAGTRKQLEEIVAAKQAALDARKDAESAQNELETTRAAAAADLAAATKIHDDNAATFDVLAKQLAGQETALADRKAKADAVDTDLTARKTALTVRETEVKAREDQVFTREVENKKTWEAAQALKAEYEQKVAALQAAIR